MQNSSSIILVAETTNAADTSAEMTGFCQLYPRFCSMLAQPIYTLYDLFVASEVRQTGSGRALLMAAHAHAKAPGVARLDFTTAITNLVAQSLYQSLGWSRDEVVLSYRKSA